MSEKSDFWVDDFPNKVILALIVMIMKHLKMKMPFQLVVCFPANLYPDWKGFQQSWYPEKTEGKLWAQNYQLLAVSV